MSYLVTVTWIDPDGSRSGAPFNAGARSQAEVARQIDDGFAAARRAKGRDPLVQITDDLTGACVAKILRGGWVMSPPAKAGGFPRRGYDAIEHMRGRYSSAA